jgi:hypothetical protein
VNKKIKVLVVHVTVKVGGLVGNTNMTHSSTPKFNFPVKEFPPKCMYCMLIRQN